MEYSKQLQVLEDANVPPKYTIESMQEYLMTLQPKILEELMTRVKYYPSKEQIIEAMEEFDETIQRNVIKKIGYIPPQLDVIEALQKMTPSLARETVEIAEVNPKPTPELIADELMSYPELKRQKLLDSIDILPSNEATTRKMNTLSFEEQRQVMTIYIFSEDRR